MLPADGKAKTNQRYYAISYMKAVSIRRNGRESLDCALALQELTEMGVDNIITFDAHDPRVQNAIPLNGFDTVHADLPVHQGIVQSRTWIFISTSDHHDDHQPG